MQPTLYYRNNAMQRRDAKHVLDCYYDLVTWAPAEDSVQVLDVGCGTGDVTCELLLPKVPKGCEVVGCDESNEMVEFAKSKWRKEFLSFRLMDIAEPQIPVDFEGRFDHVFSFYCLHWIQNQSRATENLYNLLKPGGDMLVTFLASNPIYTIYENLVRYNKWRPYMYNYKKYISPYHHSENPVKDLKAILLEAGFKIHVCEILERSYTFPSFKVLKQAVMAVSPFLPKIPENLQEEYLSDYCVEVRRTKNVRVYPGDNNNEEEIFYQYELFVAYVSK